MRDRQGIEVRFDMGRSMVHRLAVLVAVLALLVAACGGATTSPAASSAGDSASASMSPCWSRTTPVARSSPPGA